MNKINFINLIWVFIAALVVFGFLYYISPDLVYLWIFFAIFSICGYKYAINHECPRCGNYLSIKREKKLSFGDYYKCKSCGYEEEIFDKDYWGGAP